MQIGVTTLFVHGCTKRMVEAQGEPTGDVSQRGREIVKLEKKQVIRVNILLASMVACYH